ncbi:MAG TPA: malto-oligosyltrehalose trehalohydrolase [Pseudolabrys sp.]|nr:malto-oligosyltrehalose trehalohydrolase [Pseudolabrys sp.]
MTRFGPLLTERGVRFRLWAPNAKTVELAMGGALRPMTARESWFTLDTLGATAGTRYQFRIDGKLTIADPASRFQPEDVGGPSEVIAQDYVWACTDWRGRPWEEASFLELHVGTFTPEGTFRAAIEKLDHVADAGITAIEVMPVADFPGRWNWGYDGVLWFAPDSLYGRPEDLKALIDAAHERGLMVFLDVVYNHFGPDGNYLGRLAPQFFGKAQTPWGGAINYSAPEVRAFAIENALMWLRDYRFDGLRLDAVHAIITPGTPHILHDLSAAVGELARETGRHIHLVLENDDNRASLLAPLEEPPQGRYRAQWNDDYHHAWHAWLTGENFGYYGDYKGNTGHIARAMAEGFAYQGEPSPHRGGVKRGELTRDLSPLAFVNFLQNHDQVGNRARGERLVSLAAPAMIEAALTILLLSPAPPLLFMGEEWGAQQPFPFFCDFKGDLADAVRDGRKREFAEAYADDTIEVPDPLAEATMRSAKLDWAHAQTGAGQERLGLTKALLHARREHVVPLLRDLMPGAATASFDRKLLQAEWRTPNQALRLAAMFGPGPPPTLAADTIIWERSSGDPQHPWTIIAGIGAA